MPFDSPQRITRRRSSAGPVPPRRQINSDYDDRNAPHRQGQGPRPTFLALRDHGKVYVADLPNLSDGQLVHICKEAEEVLESLERRISDLEREAHNGFGDSDTFIKASTKRDVTRRFIRAIQGEQEHRLNNPALRSAAAESLPRTFLEISRHRLPGATFDSLLQEALAACELKELDSDIAPEAPVKVVPIRSTATTLPVVVTPDPNLPSSTSA
ncbi:MAG: histidine phosphotransferase [Cyanobacteriota bacterium]|nr:histidine phosphotransferase [Cyanobacteriota bacterium]